MKDYKQPLIGLGLIVLVIAGIALTEPETANPDVAKPSVNATQSKPKPEPQPKLEPQSNNAIEAPVPKISVMELVNEVDEPDERIRVLTRVALSHLKADKEIAPLLDALLEQFDAITHDPDRLAIVVEVKHAFAETADDPALSGFMASLLKLEQTLNPGPVHADKLLGGIEAPAHRIQALAQIAVALHTPGQADLSTALLKQAQTEFNELTDTKDKLIAQSALIIANMKMGQPDAAKEINVLLQAVATLESTTVQLSAYQQLAQDFAPLAAEEAVATQLEVIQTAILKIQYQADPILRLVSGVNDPSGRVRVLCSLAGSLAQSGDPVQSAAMLAKAQELVATLESPGHLAPALTHLAAAQAMVGQAKDAKVTLAKAMESVDSIRSVDEQAAVLGALVSAVETMENAEHLDAVLAQSLKTANAIQQQAQSVMQQSLRLINRLPAGEQKAAALQQIAEAIEQGGAGQFSELQFELATLHHEGRHLPKDLKRAVSWYQKAASGGNANAQLNLAVMLLEGEGLDANPVEALKWLFAAAEQGHAEGQVALGMMLALGQGVEADLVQAHKWVTLSNKSGNEDAAAALEQLAPKLTPDQLAQSAKLVEEWEAKQVVPSPSPSDPATPPAAPAPTEPAAQETEPTKTAGK